MGQAPRRIIASRAPSQASGSPRASLNFRLRRRWACFRSIVRPIGNADIFRSQTRRLQVHMYKRRPRIPKIQLIHRLTYEGLLSTGMPNQPSPHLQRRHQNIQAFESNDSQTRFTYAPTLSILLIPTLLAHYDYSSCLYLHPYLHADATLSHRGLYPDAFLGPKYRLRIIRRSLLSLTPFSSPLLIHGISPSL